MRFPFILTIVLALQLTTVGFGARARDFENAPGWEWLAPPAPVSVGEAASRDGILIITSTDATSAFVATIGWKPSAGTSYRAVAFDDSRRRHLSDLQIGPGNSEMSMMRFTWLSESLGDATVTHVGFEMLTPAGWPLASREAVKRAKETGIDVLAYPELGKRYAFDVITMDGKTIRSEKLRGKIVIVDCWATWCAPCMKSIPQIEALKTFCPNGRIEIIGINFDSDARKLEKALTEKQIDWQTVHVPAEPEVRDLWFEASSIRMLPRYLVMDQSGVIKLDTHAADEVERTVKSLCDDSE